MDNAYYSKNLNEGEDLVKIIHRHPITMAGALIAASFFIILDFFFITLLFAQGWWGIGIFFALLIFILILVWRTWIIWAKNTFIVTNKRVIDVDQHGFFSKTVSECNYDKIQDVSYSIKGLLATLFHFGSIKIQTAGNVANLELDYLKDPAFVQELITDQQRGALSSETEKELTKEEILSVLHQAKRGVDEETLKKRFKP